MARPTDYRKEYNLQAYKLCLLGAIDTELADFFKVSQQTLNTWKKKHPKFLESLRNGKEVADANVGSKLYEKATGYKHDEDKIFNDGGKPLVVPTIKHYPPDTTACIFWLKNRQRKKWRDRTEIEQSGQIDMTLTRKVIDGDAK